MVLENDLEIIFVLNKVDFFLVKLEEVIDDIVDFLGCDFEEVILVSVKIGIGIEEILKVIVECVLVFKGIVDEFL